MCVSQHSLTASAAVEEKEASEPHSSHTASCSS
jgi:hypothetical protein